MMGIVRFARRACGCSRGILLLGMFVCVFATATVAAPLTYIVNSPADVPDVNPGDGVCETVAGNGVCTLRAAIQESNSGGFNDDTIVLQPNVTYLLTRAGFDDKALNGDLDILGGLTIIGAASVVDGNGAAVGERVFDVHRCSRDAVDMVTNDCTFGEVFVKISGITIQHGGAGGIANQGHLTMEDCIVTENTINHVGAFYPWGGGIANTGSLTVTGSVVSNNVSADDTHSAGGGIFSNGHAMTIDSTTISGNVVYGAPDEGGGIYSVGSGKVIIKNSTVSGNSAGLGGGIYMGGSDNVVVVNSTISGNSSSEDGGGIYFSAGTGGLYNVTIAQNRANADERGSAIGGGVFNTAGASLSFANSIIAGNDVVIPTTGKPIHDPDQCFGTIISLGNNLLSDIDLDHCTVTGPYNVASVALGQLQNNGGPTKTHALPVGSAAIDAGNMGGCVDADGAPIAKDQRGVPRPFGSSCDVGAFEASDVIFLNAFEIGV
jgi:CSLREA domain-containing protein